jgi:hypothetical protein
MTAITKASAPNHEPQSDVVDGEPAGAATFSGDAEKPPLTKKPLGRRKKTFNINTYKAHALGDYVATIRRYGTTDSYSTEPVSLRCLLGVCLLTLSPL